MTGNTTDYFLKMFVDPVEANASGNEVFAVSGRLRHRGRRPKPGVPLREDGDPVVLELSGRLLEAFAEQAFAAGYVVRVDVSRAEGSREPWPRWCHTSQQVAGLLASLQPRPGDMDHMRIYPVSIWFLPAKSAKSEALVETFRVLRMDDAIFSELLQSGVFRIALFDAFFDLLADLSLAVTLTGWMRTAVRAAGADVEWDPQVGS